jgi:hypothetical protein
LKAAKTESEHVFKDGTGFPVNSFHRDREKHAFTPGTRMDM